MPIWNTPVDSAGTDFALLWRDELLAQAWEGSCAIKMNTAGYNMPCLTRAGRSPGPSSTALAEVLTDRLGQPLRPDAVRQTLRRRHRGTYLRAEVALMLETDLPAAVEQELADLGLLTYCRPA